MKNFQQTQLDFALHLRDPDQYPAPVDIEDRRMSIYRDLIYNNIESFIAGGFPVLRSLMADDHWHAMVRDFIMRHACQTPYFLEISQEFLHYLMQERGRVAGDPVFMLELAHYEWVELAMDIAEASVPMASAIPENLLASRPQVSPLVMCLEYQYPVHKIAPHFQPTQPEPTQLVVYRNRADEVKFMIANAITLRLLFLLQQPECEHLGAALTKIAQELQHQNPQSLNRDGLIRINELAELSIISHFAQ